METLTSLRAMEDNELEVLRQRASLLENLTAERFYERESRETKACSIGNCIQRRRNRRNNSLKEIIGYVKRFPGATRHDIIVAMEAISNTREYIGILVARGSIREDVVNRGKHYYIA